MTLSTKGFFYKLFSALEDWYGILMPRDICGIGGALLSWVFVSILIGVGVITVLLGFLIVVGITWALILLMWLAGWIALLVVGVPLTLSILLVGIVYGLRAGALTLVWIKRHHKPRWCVSIRWVNE